MLRRIAYPLVIVLLPFAMYVQLWHGNVAEREHIAGDPGDAYWPDMVALELALFQGEFPLWNPYERAGFPFAADPQPGVLYPLNWLLVAIGHALGGVSFNMLQFKLLVHLSIAGLGMYLFLRERAQPRAASAVAGITYQFGGFLAYNVMFSLNWPLAWTPWLLLSIDRIVREPKPVRAVELAFVATLTVVAGSPPAMFYSALIAAPYGLYRLLSSIQGEPLERWARRVLPSVALGCGLAVLWSLPQLIASMRLTKHTLRAQPPFSFAASGTLGPDELLGFLLRAGSNLHFYMGATALLLCPFALHRVRARKDVAFFLGVTIVGTLLTLGTNTQLFRVFYELVPGFALFRLAFRYTALVSFGVAVLAGYGVAALEQREVPAGFARGVGYLVAAFALFALFMHVSKDIKASPALVKDALMVSMLLALSWLVVFALRKHDGAPGYAACMVMMVFADFSVHVPRAGPVWATARAREEYISTSELKKLRAELGSYRVYNEFGLENRPGSRLLVRDFRGYMDPLMLDRYAQLMTDEIKLHPAQMLSLFSVKYLLFAPHAVMNMQHHFIPSPLALPGVTKKSEHVFELADPAPNAYWVNKLTVLPNDGAVRAGLWQVDYHKGALVSREDLSASERAWAQKLPGAHASVPARVLFRNFNQVGFAVEAPAEGLLVVNEAYFDGWRAEVDGQATPIVRVNSMMQGVRVAAGKHRVELRFRPYYYLVPCWLALASIVLLLAAWLWPRVQAFRQRRAL